jgi:carbon storage regulator
MLVLTRKVGESIVIPAQGLIITVVGVAGTRIRIGIAGPPEVAVHREEVWRRLQSFGAEEPPGGVPLAGARECGRG